MDISIYKDISKNIKTIIEDEMNGNFIPTSIKDYPPLETEIIDFDQQIDEVYFGDGEKCSSFESKVVRSPADLVVDIPTSTALEFKLKYFLDGSFRTYYWGDIEIGNLSFPVILGETVVAIVERENSKFKKSALSKKINIVLPPEEYAEICNLRTKLYNTLTNKYSWVSVETLKKDQEKIKDLKTSMLGKIREILHNEERQKAGELQRRDEEILVIDGDLRKEIFADLQNTIGLAKSFSLKPLIIAQLHNISLSSILRCLKKGQRTHVFVKEGMPQYKFWYIRLRNPEECENYWQGVVKVEVNMKSLTSPTKTFIEYVEHISRLIYEERNPSSYPKKRWASHIYPVYVAENLAKASLFSPHVFRQLLKVI